MTSRRPSPILDRPPHSEAALEAIATQALQKHGYLLPRSPAPIIVERLIEEAFGFNETYEELETGVLGEIRFAADDRPLAIRVARRLAVIDALEPSIDHERRATLAHECGHGLVHTKMFADGLRRDRAPRLPGFETAQTSIVCHDADLDPACPRPVPASSTERWLEWEANYLMGALLMPRDLVFQLVTPYTTGRPDGISPRELRTELRNAATAAAATEFNVSLGFAASRLATVLPKRTHPDLFETDEPVRAGLAPEGVPPRPRTRRPFTRRTHVWSR
jgi:IrrE N-terminal-like domain